MVVGIQLSMYKRNNQLRELQDHKQEKAQGGGQELTTDQAPASYGETREHLMEGEVPATGPSTF